MEGERESLDEYGEVHDWKNFRSFNSKRYRKVTSSMLLTDSCVEIVKSKILFAYTSNENKLMLRMVD